MSGAGEKGKLQMGQENVEESSAEASIHTTIQQSAR